MEIYTFMLMLLGTIIAISAINIALISWVRSDMKEAVNEIRCDTKLFQLEVTRWKEEIHKEMRDFHGRLCAIEEKGKKK